MKSNKCAAFLVVLILAALAAQPAYAAATISIVNGNAPGVGFNDPTPVAPIGGNAGTTLGEQRLIAFQAAADIWGANLNSTVEITILATFEPLACDATSAVLGSAGATEIWRDFSGAPFPGTWYNFALANKIFGADLDPATAQIRARFNVNLGQPNCLTGTFWYLGLDTNHGLNIDLVTVLLHEFAHGLGFQTFTSGQTGAFVGGFPSAYDHFTYDSTAGKTWFDMATNAERAASAINPRKVAWNGPNVMTDMSLVLANGTPLLEVTAPASVAGNYQIGAASFGPPVSSPGVTGEVMPVVDQANGTGLACNPLSSANAAAVNGKIALVDRGVCTFVVKVKNAQNAGAIAVLVADNVAGAPPSGLGGADPTITIPSVRISLPDGNTLKSALKYRSRLHSGMFATLGLDLSIRAGGDPAGRVLLFTPNPYQSGSSVSHWDTIAFPNLLMRPTSTPT